MSSDYQMALWSELNLGPMQLPEHTLLLAIVERAILDYVGAAKTMPHHRREGAAFFACTEDAPFSFIWICMHLPFNAEWFRETILRYVKQEHAKRVKEKIERRCGSVAILRNE